MTNPENQDQNDEILLGDLFRPLIQHRRLIWQGTIGATVIAVLLGAQHFFLQPTAWSAGIGFRPVFEGGAEADRKAVREYSGVPSTPTATATSGAASGRFRSSSEVQALTPQIDRTFVEGIVALSAAAIPYPPTRWGGGSRS